MLRKNTEVIITATVFTFLYIAIALGHFPSIVNCRFSLAAASIFVIVLSFVAACGSTFYWNQKLTPLTVEVVPIILLAIGLDSLFIIVDAE